MNLLDSCVSLQGNDVQKRLAQTPNSLLGSLELAVLLPTVKTNVDPNVGDHFKGVFLYCRGHLSVIEVTSPL